MSAILLDNDGLKAFVQETIRQALAANEAIECETGVTITPKFKVAFSGVVVAKGGLNALKRQIVDSAAEQTSEVVDEAFTEVSTRIGKQQTKSNEKSVVAATEKQDGTNAQTSEQHQSGSSTDKRASTTAATENGTTKSDATSKENTKGETQDHAEQSQAQGTRQETTTEYSR
jgi:hypothetical protein